MARRREHAKDVACAEKALDQRHSQNARRKKPEAAFPLWIVSSMLTTSSRPKQMTYEEQEGQLISDGHGSDRGNHALHRRARSTPVHTGTMDQSMDE